MAQAALDFETGTILQLFGLVTGLFAIRAIASAMSALLLGRFAGRAGYRFRNNFAKYFLRKPFGAFEGVNSGESLSVYSNDVPQTIELVAGAGVQMIADFITLIVAIVYMFIINISLSIIFFAAFPVLIAMQVFIAGPIQKKEVVRSRARADFLAVANDSLQNTSTIAAYSLEEVMENRCVTANEKVISATKGYLVSLMPLLMSGMIASMTPMLLIFAIAAYRVISGNLGFAEFIVFISLAGETGSWLTMLSQRQAQVQTSAGGAKRLMDIMDGVEENFATGKTLEIADKGEVAISATNLSFAYSTRANTDESTDEAQETMAIDNVSFTIKKGSRVAFVGGSGSGKSTILKLLLGLYAPSSGNLQLMGTDTADISLNSLRATFAYVPQDSFLFPETIGANITGEAKPSDITRLEKACADAGILDFIQTLPDNFDSMLNESAENISGGQKQRIALARAFYRDSPIILFDEATSALDPTTESAILGSFDTLAADKTVVMVAHRIKPIAFCDTIVVMDAGKIAAIGTHDQLMQDCNIYKNLYDSQNKAVEVAS